jgi:RHS repeat-associated protein
VRQGRIAGAEQVLTYPHPSVKLTDGVKSFLHRDGLLSVCAITSAAGVKIESALYKPFGEASEWVQPGNLSPETKGRTRERFDADAGLQYLNARYYDPELSLFLQPDWFEVTQPGVGTNRFSYSFNDPVNKFDPGGNDTASYKQARRERKDGLQGVKKEGATKEGLQTMDIAVPSSPFDDVLVVTKVDGVLVPSQLPPEASGVTTFRVTPSGYGYGQIVGVPKASDTSTGYHVNYSGGPGLSRIIDDAAPESSMVEVSNDGNTLTLTTIHGSPVGSAEVEITISNGEVSVSYTTDDPIESNVSMTTCEYSSYGYRVKTSEPISLTQKAIDWMSEMATKRLK